MSNKVNALLTELNLPLNDSMLLSCGIWTEKGILRVSPFDLVLTKEGVETPLDAGSVTRAKLIALISSPEEMAPVIKDLAHYIIRNVARVSKMEQPTIVGERVIVKSGEDVFRINVNTYNVTKLINNQWIIQDSYMGTARRIDSLHSVLIQCGLM